MYLVKRYLLRECVDRTYRATNLLPGYFSYICSDVKEVHGPAYVSIYPRRTICFNAIYLAGSQLTIDYVQCVRCLSWPTQAADWQIRHRRYGWPDSAVVDHVVTDGCDVVCVAHRLCRQNDKNQWRLSFSRAEVVLLNSWMPVQQIVYHVLRVYVKTERLTDSTNNLGAGILSNYNLKTLMLWACELKPRSWWNDNMNIVRICVKLLHILSVWLTDARCKHYFINNCNLFDHHDNSQFAEITANRLMSVKRLKFSEWFFNTYIHECAQICPGYFSWLFKDRSTTTDPQQNALSALVRWKLNRSLFQSWLYCAEVQRHIAYVLSDKCLQVQSWSHLMRQLANSVHHDLAVYYSAITFLNIAYKTSPDALNDEMLDVLLTTLLCKEFRNVRLCRRARKNKDLSVDLATMLMYAVIFAKPGSTELQILFELRRAYLYRAMSLSYRDMEYDFLPPKDQRTLPLKFNTSALVELLQKFAVERLTEFRQIEARYFGSEVGIVTTDYEAMYAYKCGDYQRCLQLSTHNVRFLIGSHKTIISCVYLYSVFLQLMDDDIVSLTGLTLLTYPLSMEKNADEIVINQLTLSLYLTTQCKVKLRHSLMSLARTQDYVRVTRRTLRHYETLDHLLLKLIEHKILKYLGTYQ